MYRAQHSISAAGGGLRSPAEVEPSFGTPTILKNRVNPSRQLEPLVRPRPRNPPAPQPQDQPRGRDGVTTSLAPRRDPTARPPRTSGLGRSGPDRGADVRRPPAQRGHHRLASRAQRGEASPVHACWAAFWSGYT